MMKPAVSDVGGYHAHVYYDPDSRERAARVRDGLSKAFTVRLGRWHDKAVGPHPKGMYQVAFSADEFARVVPWLMLNREGLDVLVHPESGDDLTDHTAHAMWLGDKLTLNTEIFGEH